MGQSWEAGEVVGVSKNWRNPSSLESRIFAARANGKKRDGRKECCVRCGWIKIIYTCMVSRKNCSYFGKNYIYFRKIVIIVGKKCNYCPNMFNSEGINVFGIIRMKKRINLERNGYKVCRIVNCFQRKYIFLERECIFSCILSCHFIGIYSLCTPLKSQAFNDSNWPYHIQIWLGDQKLTDFEQKKEIRKKL